MEYKGFISYAHKDNEDIEVAKIFIKQLEKFTENNKIELWYDEKNIPIGSQWFKEIKKEIDSCHFGVLLVSENFVSSDFIKNEEFNELVKLSQSKNIKLFPILLNTTNFDSEEIKTNWNKLLNMQIKKFEGKPYSQTCLIQNNGVFIHNPQNDDIFKDISNEIKKELDSITSKSDIKKNEKSNNEILEEDKNDVFFLLDRKLFKEDIKNFLDLEFNQNRFIVKYIEKLDISDDIIKWLLEYSESINYQRIIFYFNQKSPDSLLINFSEKIEEFRDNYDDEAFENFYKEFKISKILNLNSKKMEELITNRNKESIKNIDLDELKKIFKDDLSQINTPLLVIINIDSFHNFTLIKPIFNSKNKNIKFIFLTTDYKIYKENQHYFRELYSLKDVFISELEEYLNEETNITDTQKDNILKRVKNINVEKVAHNEIKKIMIKLLNIETYSQIKAKK